MRGKGEYGGLIVGKKEGRMAGRLTVRGGEKKKGRKVRGIETHSTLVICVSSETSSFFL